MDERVVRLKTPTECATFEKNVIERGRPDLALDARKRALELQAQAFGATTKAEKECIEAVYAYERALTDKNGKTTRASRTWPMIKRLGIIAAVDQIVTRTKETVGYATLLEMGLEDYAFEAVVLRYPYLFSKDAVEHSQSRVNEWKQNK